MMVSKMTEQCDKRGATHVSIKDNTRSDENVYTMCEARVVCEAEGTQAFPKKRVHNQLYVTTTGSEKSFQQGRGIRGISAYTSFKS